MKEEDGKNDILLQEITIKIQDTHRLDPKERVVAVLSLYEIEGLTQDAF